MGQGVDHPNPSTHYGSATDEQHINGVMCRVRRYASTMSTRRTGEPAPQAAPWRGRCQKTSSYKRAGRTLRREGVLQRQPVPNLQEQVIIPDLGVGGDVGMPFTAERPFGQRLLKEGLLGQELVD